MEKTLYTVKLAASEATIEGARAKLALRPEQIDPSFGVVNVDPDNDLYAVMIDSSVVDESSRNKDLSGPFSNPKIETFGRVRG
jgi:hypothetical protein